jgi:hypothetical protein
MVQKVVLQVFHERAGIDVLGVFLHSLQDQLRLRVESLVEVFELVGKFMFGVDVCDVSFSMLLLLLLPPRGVDVLLGLLSQSDDEIFLLLRVHPSFPPLFSGDLRSSFVARSIKVTVVVIVVQDVFAH